MLNRIDFPFDEVLARVAQQRPLSLIPIPGFGQTFTKGLRVVMSSAVYKIPKAFTGNALKYRTLVVDRTRITGGGHFSVFLTLHDPVASNVRLGSWWKEIPLPFLDGIKPGKTRPKISLTVSRLNGLNAPLNATTAAHPQREQSASFP